MTNIPVEFYVSLWDVFYVLLAILLECVAFMFVLGGLFWMSRKFLDRIAGVHFSVMMVDRRDGYDK